ncbi:hypothetical protein TSAR_011359, partial [Trichomalopsis sarcophagae]
MIEGQVHQRGVPVQQQPRLVASSSTPQVNSSVKFDNEQCKEAQLPVTCSKHPQQQSPPPAGFIYGMSAAQHPQIARMTPTGGRSRTCSESNVGAH